MKLLVFSDSHSRIDPMLEAVRAQCPDMVVHLGDLLRDARALADACTRLPVIRVPGNCDGWTSGSAVRTLELSGRRILLGHGHQWGVKQGSAGAVAAARSAHADILLFGHTHLAFCEQMDGLWVMNPGAIGGADFMTYGVIILEKHNTLCYTVPD